MFSYYGSKSKVVHLYPKPKFNRIIEPFAGSARYSLRHFENDIWINDKYDVVYKIWKYLQNCSAKDILSLPDLPVGFKIEREKFDCIEQAWLMGFIINGGQSTPMLTVSKWGKEKFIKQRKFIAENLFKIKHWKITNLDYTEIANVECTWFIDAPYETAGYKYRLSKIDFDVLKEYCLNRFGQIIVCESLDASWLEFKPFAKFNGIKKSFQEGIWTNEPSSFNNQQLQIF